MNNNHIHHSRRERMGVREEPRSYGPPSSSQNYYSNYNNPPPPPSQSYNNNYPPSQPYYNNNRRESNNNNYSRQNHNHPSSNNNNSHYYSNPHNNNTNNNYNYQHHNTTHSSTPLSPAPVIQKQESSTYFYLPLTEQDKFLTVLNNNLSVSSEIGFRLVKEYTYCQEKHLKLLIIIGKIDNTVPNLPITGLQGFVQVIEGPYLDPNENNTTSTFLVPIKWRCASYASWNNLPSTLSSYTSFSPLSYEIGRAAREELMIQAAFASVLNLRTMYSINPTIPTLPPKENEKEEQEETSFMEAEEGEIEQEKEKEEGSIVSFFPHDLKTLERVLENLKKSQAGI